MEHECEMRTSIIAVLLTQLLFAPAVVAGERSIVGQAALNEGARLAHPANAASRAPGPVSAANQSKGHPVLLGIAIGAGSGALLGAVSSSCSSPSTPEFPHPCGSRLWLEGAVLGAGLGAGVGALAGLVVWAVRR
jgi:hypothetical protein